MPKESGHEFTSFETESHKLAYDNDFREMLRSTPGLLKSVIAIIERAEAEYRPENLKIYDFECRWNSSEKNWEIIKEKDKELPASIPLLEHRIGKMGRGVYFKPTQPYVDSTTEVQIVLLGVAFRHFPEHGSHQPERIDETGYIKLAYRDKVFFVKKSVQTNMPGYREFLNTITARKALEALPFVKVIEPKL